MRKLFFLFLIIGLACRVYAQCSVVTISPTYPTVCGGSGSTTITANPTGGAGPYTYSWNTGQTTQSIVVTVGGTYIVTVSSPGCPPVIDSVKVIQATIPAAWNSGPVCEGSTLFLSAANFDNATYNWTGPNSFTDSIKEPFINNVTFSNAGVYRVSVTVNGCTSAQGATTVTVVAKPPTPVAGNNGPLCVGATLNLTASNVTGATYSWTATNGYTSPVQNPAINSVGNADGGKYYVSLTVNGCTSEKDSTTVVIKPSPPTPPAGNNGPLCDGSNLNLSAGIVPNVTYTWTGPNGFTSSLQDPVISNATFINAGIYNVSTTANGCTGLPGFTTVIINPFPAMPVAGNNGPLCIWTTLNLTANTIVGASYNWTGPNGFSSTLQNPVISNVTPSNAGNYVVKVTVNGCTSGNGSTTVVIKPIPAAPVPNNNGPLCIGATLNLTANALTGATYNWTGPNGFNAAIQNPVVNNVSPANAGTYSATVTIDGCTSLPATTTLIIKPTPAVPTAGNNGPLCVGSALGLTATAVAGATYNWTGPNGFSSALQNPGIASVALTDAGIYSVTATSSGCTSAGGSTDVVIYSIPTAPVAGNSGPACIGATLNLTANTITGATYNWSGPNGFTSTNQNPVINNITALTAGKYYVYVIVNGCISPMDSTIVVVKPLPQTPTANNNGPVCVGTTLYLSASAVAGASYSWTGPNGFTSTQQNPTIPNVTLAEAGTYSVTATVNGCTGLPGSTTVVVKLIPAPPVVSNNGPLCVGSALNLTTPAIAGASYSWTGPNGFTSSLQNPVINNVSLLNAGTYNLNNSVNGCASVNGSTTVIINPNPPAPATSNSGPLCEGTTLSLSASTLAGASYSWTGPNGFTSNLQNPVINNITLANAGIYKTTVMVNSCPSPSAATTVIVNSAPAAPLAGNNGLLCIGATLNLTAGTIAGATYSWTGPNGFTASQQNPAIANVTLANAGVYSVSATVNGCMGLAGTTTVFINSIPPNPVVSNNGPVCAGSVLNLTTTPIAGATYNWTGPNGFTSTQQNPAISNVTLANAGVYSLSIPVAGCPSVGGTTTVVVIPIPATPVAGNSGPVCDGSALTLTAGTIAGATYNWMGPNGFISNQQNPTIPTVTLAAAGMYSVTATVNGCTSIPGTTTVIVNAIPATPVVNNNGPLCVGSSLNLTTPVIAGATYSWTGPNGFTSSLQNPAIPNVTLANAGTYTITETVSGCAGLQGATTVVINPIPTIPAANNNGPLCVGSGLTLTATGLVGATYNWAGPNGFTSGQQNPGIPTVTLADAGTYNVTLTVSGCTGLPGSTTVVVNPIPATPVVSNNGPLCVGAGLNLTAGIIPAAIYSWTGPNGFLSTQQNPQISSISLVNAGTYSVTAEVNACTSAVGTTLVSINDPAIANAGSDQVVCASNSLVNISGMVTGGSGTGIWSTNGSGTFSPGPTNLAAAYILTNADKTAGNVTLTLTSINNGACPVSVSSLLVTIPQAITVNAGYDQGICASDINVGLNGQVMAAAGGIWTTTGSGTFSPDNTTLKALYIPGNADKLKGSVLLILTSTGNGNCMAVSDTVVLTINPGPAVNAGADKFVLENDTISLQPIVAGLNLKYLWTPSLYLNNDTVKFPIVTGFNDQLYTLKATDAFGCSNQDDVFVKVLKLPKIPNTFTPNNDGINDLWIIKYLEDYPDCRVSVFNRYGQLVFESRGYTTPWDGTYKGKPLPFGTYYYIVEPGNKVKPSTGYITIIK